MNGKKPNLVFNLHKDSNLAFFGSVILLCIAYLLTQLILIPHTIITADEFVFMRHLLDYTQFTPYQDFPPYKSTLGHYLISLPLFFSQSLIDSFFYIKDEIALINTCCIALTLYWGAKFFNKSAIFLAMLAILANQYSLYYMSDLRVDMLAAWFCLFSALSILQCRFQLAGFCMGIAFLISQKALWYLIAINAGMITCWYAYATYRIRALLLFNGYTAIILILYLAIWSLISTPSNVLYNFFYDSYIQAGINYYLPVYGAFWQAMLSHGPALFLLWPQTFILLSDRSSTQQTTWLFISVLAATTIILFISYKQPFPYNFVLTLPAFFLVYAAFFTWLLEKKSTYSSYPLFIVLLYVSVMIYIITSLKLSAINYLLVLLPITLYIIQKRISAIAIFYCLFVAVAIFYPLYLTWQAARFFNGDYQQTMIKTIAALTSDGSDYIAGVPLLYKKDQPILGLKNLISPQIAYLYTEDKTLEPLLLPSIYLAPTTSQTVIQDIERANIKLFVTNFRTLHLPPAIIHFISDHYQHYYGSIYLYAPRVKTNQLSFFIKFTGNYRIEAPRNTLIYIDRKRQQAGKIIRLQKGDHFSHTKKDYRLVLIPDGHMSLDPRYQNDDWSKML